MNFESDTTNPENDEDDHYCLKCKNVIRGLSHYIEHRKAKCVTKDQVRDVTTQHSCPLDLLSFYCISQSPSYKAQLYTDTLSDLS